MTKKKLRTKKDEITTPIKIAQYHGADSLSVSFSMNATKWKPGEAMEVSLFDEDTIVLKRMHPTVDERLLAIKKSISELVNEIIELQNKLLDVNIDDKESYERLGQCLKSYNMQTKNIEKYDRGIDFELNEFVNKILEKIKQINDNNKLIRDRLILRKNSVVQLNECNKPEDVIDSVIGNEHDEVQEE